MTPKEKMDLEKFMYEKVYDELNRSRDWPIKIMAFASALFITLIGVLKIDNTSVQLNCETKLIISIILLVFALFTCGIIIRQHLNYVDYRNIQKGIQKEWKIDEINGIPLKWIAYEAKKISFWRGLKNGVWGWSFYAIYILAIACITICLILY